MGATHVPRVYAATSASWSCRTVRGEVRQGLPASSPTAMPDKASRSRTRSRTHELGIWLPSKSRSRLFSLQGSGYRDLVCSSQVHGFASVRGRDLVRATGRLRSVSWEMKVRDVFLLSDGRTVFVGSVTGGPLFINGDACGVFVDGEEVCDAEVMEEMPARRDRPAGDERVLGTRHAVDLTAETVRAHDVRLRAGPSVRE